MQIDHRAYANAAIAFLNRASIQGAEAEAIVNIKAWLTQIQNGQLTVKQQPEEIMTDDGLLDEAYAKKKNPNKEE
jgi:hypothetical protein